VEIISVPNADNALANAVTPVLSDTLINARMFFSFLFRFSLCD
jgi:hypothetical protein